MSDFELVRDSRPQTSTRSHRLIERQELHAYDIGKGKRLTLAEYETEELGLRDVGPKERQRLSAKGHALPDGSYPIANASDLKNAIKAFGRAKNKAAAKAHIKRRARALNMTESLPENWR
jgi:hypothetical protein